MYSAIRWVMLEDRRIYPINRYVKFIKNYYTFGI
jgi:hypothetical protein